MTMITGKDAPLEDSITRMSAHLQRLGFEIEEVQWLNPVPNVWSCISGIQAALCFMRMVKVPA